MLTNFLGKKQDLTNAGYLSSQIAKSWLLKVSSHWMRDKFQLPGVGQWSKHIRPKEQCINKWLIVSSSEEHRDVIFWLKRWSTHCQKKKNDEIHTYVLLGI